MKAKTKRPEKKERSMKPMAVPSSDKETISIRPIMNGFIVRKARSTKDGYEETEYYTDKKPEIEMPKRK